MISSNTLGSPEELIWFLCFGEAFYDVEGAAHERYSVANDKGAILILRPDGTIGIILRGRRTVAKYFEKLVIADRGSIMSNTQDYRTQLTSAAGKVDLQRENGLGDTAGVARVDYETA